ncbi:hypothetical protein H7J50_02205 [Mycobacterium intermedium]|nr:hypothetical protein [Mycobacterium intermedium]MCV6962633.1 hypothetical protein [Mycobacterium intermedium]
MRFMSETNEIPTAPTTTAVAPPPVATVHQTPKVFKAAAWVAIVAGIVFIVAVIFFSGFRLGLAAGHGGHHFKHHRHHGMMHQQGIPNSPPASVAPGGPGGPGQVPTSVAPSLAPATTPGR